MARDVLQMTARNAAVSSLRAFRQRCGAKKGPSAERAPERRLEWQKLRCYKREWRNQFCVSQLSDQELLVEVQVAAGHERDSMARLIALLAEVDERRLYLGGGARPSSPTAPGAAPLGARGVGRIEAARAARRFPVVLELLAAGALTLTAVRLLAPHLTTDNHARC